MSFEPSSESRTSVERVRAALRYIRRAVDVLEAELEKKETLPPWVTTHVLRAAVELGTAANSVRSQERT